jgi:hypothetical protein
VPDPSDPAPGDSASDDPVLFPHTGTWRYHDDDCRCTWVNPYCNRDGWVWSCCGACKEKSDCSAPHKHPTYWTHPKSSACNTGYKNNWPVHRTNAEIRAVAPECFPNPAP